jgi:hypothetical protein
MSDLMTDLPCGDKVMVVIRTPGVDRVRARQAEDRNFHVLTLAHERIIRMRACSPPRILPGQPPNQLTDLLRDRRASGGIRLGPLLLDEAPVPGEQGAGHHDPLYPKVPGQ